MSLYNNLPQTQLKKRLGLFIAASQINNVSRQDIYDDYHLEKIVYMP